MAIRLTLYAIYKINMLQKQVLLLLAFFVPFGFSFGQSLNKDKINTTGAEAYFEIATALEKGESVTAFPGNGYFKHHPTS
jgi:hypothetical protein